MAGAHFEFGGAGDSDECVIDETPPIGDGLTEIPLS